MAKGGVPGVSTTERAVAFTEPPAPESANYGALFEASKLKPGKIMGNEDDPDLTHNTGFTKGITIVRLCQQTFGDIANKLTVRLCHDDEELIEAVDARKEDLQYFSAKAFNNAKPHCRRYCFIGISGFCPFFLEEGRPSSEQIVDILGAKADILRRPGADLRTTQVLNDIGLLTFNSGATNPRFDSSVKRIRPTTVKKMDSAVFSRLGAHIEGFISRAGVTPLRDYIQPELT